MILECPQCGEKNIADQPPQPGQQYLCGKCGNPFTFVETIETPDTLPKIQDKKTVQDEKQQKPKQALDEKTKKELASAA